MTFSYLIKNSFTFLSQKQQYSGSAHSSSKPWASLNVASKPTKHILDTLDIFIDKISVLAIWLTFNMLCWENAFPETGKDIGLEASFQTTIEIIKCCYSVSYCYMVLLYSMQYRNQCTEGINHSVRWNQCMGHLCSSFHLARPGPKPVLEINILLH